MTTARSVVRRGFTQPTRIALLEDDADTIEAAMSQGFGELKTLMRWMIGSFFSVVVAIIAALAVLAFK